MDEWMWTQVQKLKFFQYLFFIISQLLFHVLNIHSRVIALLMADWWERNYILALGLCLIGFLLCLLWASDFEIKANKMIPFRNMAKIRSLLNRINIQQSLGPYISCSDMWCNYRSKAQFISNILKISLNYTCHSHGPRNYVKQWEGKCKVI